MAEGPVNLNWDPIMKHINESPYEFFQGSWTFLCSTTQGVESEASDASDSDSEFVAEPDELAESASSAGASNFSDASPRSVVHFLIHRTRKAAGCYSRAALLSFFLFDTSHSLSGYRFRAPQCATSPLFRFDASYSPSDYIASPFLRFDYFPLRYNSDSDIILPLSFIVHTSASSCCTPTCSPDSSVYLTCHSKLKGCLDGD
ncbi:hypothetical protein BDP27DRAFT_1422943 [Rhodocollybia butyracea]|uniref:Uncharacterized protein n=1 Tax=Rhodocollybia butyracea TaxID=206335 RepID=A0A9P5PSX8_9AGAR|nr:hypothetical protein BDP27DRAFT_1422943 [Rhodocollybia butyracea]